MVERVRDIEIKFTCIAEDAVGIAESLTEWFYGNNDALRRDGPPRISEHREPTPLEIEDLGLDPGTDDAPDISRTNYDWWRHEGCTALPYEEWVTWRLNKQ